MPASYPGCEARQHGDARWTEHASSARKQSLIILRQASTTVHEFGFFLSLLSLTPSHAVPDTGTGLGTCIPRCPRQVPNQHRMPFRTLRPSAHPETLQDAVKIQFLWCCKHAVLGFPGTCRRSPLAAQCGRDGRPAYTASNCAWRIAAAGWFFGRFVRRW